MVAGLRLRLTLQLRLARRLLRLALRRELGALLLLQQPALLFRLSTLGLFHPGLGLGRQTLTLDLGGGLSRLALTLDLGGRLPLTLGGLLLLARALRFLIFLLESVRALRREALLVLRVLALRFLPGLVLACRGCWQGRHIDDRSLNDLGPNGLFLSPIQPGRPGQGEDAEDQVQGERGDQGARVVAGGLPHLRAGGTAGGSWCAGDHDGGRLAPGLSSPGPRQGAGRSGGTVISPRLAAPAPWASTIACTTLP